MFASNGDSGKAEPLVIAHATTDKNVDIGRYGGSDVDDGDATAISRQQSPTSITGPTVEQPEKKEEKYVNDLFKLLLGELPDVFGVF